MRRALSILSVALTASLLVIPAGGADAGASSSPTLRGGDASVDLSRRVGIDRYLTSIGVDRDDAVVQRGLRNYAGPSCPGPAWNCTSSSAPVVQIALNGGNPQNVFVCTPAGAGTDPATNTCVIVQSNTTGTNQAVCIEKDGQPDGLVAQSCEITQSNVSGQNIATTEQSVNMDHKETTQRSEQRTEITQVNGTGDNQADVDQRSELSAKAQGGEVGDVVQQQDVIQDAVIDQDTGVGVPPEAAAGANTATVFQSHRLEAKAHMADSVEQLQNAQTPSFVTSCPNDPNICAAFDQSSTNGSLLIDLRQELRHEAKAEPVEGSVLQQQGSSSFTGGMEGIHHQSSTGVAERFKVQEEHQTAKAQSVGSVSQIQFTGTGPRLNSNQMSNPDNVAMGSQMVVQVATDPTFQQAHLEGLAGPVSGEATFHQFAKQQDETSEQTVTGGPGFVFATIDCMNIPEEEIPPECVASDELPEG